MIIYINLYFADLLSMLKFFNLDILFYIYINIINKLIIEKNNYL